MNLADALLHGSTTSNERHELLLSMNKWDASNDVLEVLEFSESSMALIYEEGGHRFKILTGQYKSKHFPPTTTTYNHSCDMTGTTSDYVSLGDAWIRCRPNPPRLPAHLFDLRVTS